MLTCVAYDSFVRAAWARRALQKDPELDIAKEAGTLNKDMVSLAQARLQAVTPPTPSILDQFILYGCGH